MNRSSPSADLLVISHAGDRSGAPIVLLRFLDWLEHHTTLDVRVVLLHGGSMEPEFERHGARIIGGADSKLWMIQRGLTNLDFDKAASALALMRQGPTMWMNRRVPLVLMNSVGSLPALRFLPPESPAKVVLYVHELDDSFERTIGTSAWELLSPRVDHFVSCGARVTEMLIERRGIPADRVSEHHGFVDEPHPDPEGAAALRRELQIADDALVIGGSGLPEWRKGPEVLVQVLQRLRARRPDLDVHVIWMGGEVDSSPGWKLAHDVRSAGLSDRFHHLGEVTDPVRVMGATDLFALTSREDPYPLVVLEAASHGVPVVSFDNGGIVQFAGSEDPPLAEVVPYLDVDAMVDKAADLFDHPSARRAMAERARDHVLAHHLTDQAAPRLLETLARREPRLGRALVAPAPDPAAPPAHPTPAAADDEVVLVDADDAPVGRAEKLAAHREPGQLHRALSVFLLDGAGRILLQRRAATKHAFAGLWSNSCCTHPRPDESVVAAAERRVDEELGVRCTVEELGVFTYRAADPVSGLVEHEVDHVLLGRAAGTVHPDPQEVAEVTAVEVAELQHQLRTDPDRFTPWLAPALAVALDARPDLMVDPTPNTREDLLP